MTGMELARRYYADIGKPAMAGAFPDLIDRMAFGLAGEGSECFGFDDALSRDHDWGPAFCIWMTEKDFLQYGNAVQRVYADLPREYAGFPARNATAQGSGRIGCLSLERWFARYTGCPTGPQTLQEWRRIPEAFLATAVNGAVFADPLGAFTAVRERLLAYYPEDVRLKKLAHRAAIMAQAGQYNFPRCLARGEVVAAQLAKSEFLRAAISITYLLNRRYMPFYKWAHRGMGTLEQLPRMRGLAEGLCTADGAAAVELIERICLLAAAELGRQGLTDQQASFMEAHAADLMLRIRDPALRATHIMEE